jgi:tellurite resistance protein TehA-like permease
VRNLATFVATVTWAIGVILYFALIAVLMVRLLLVQVSARDLSPTYWINMGATAITVLAGARLLNLPSGAPVLKLILPAVAPVSFVLWAFGTWWIPLLVLLGIWRYVLGRAPIHYEATFWAVVFPLAMYATASAEFGGAVGLPLLFGIGGFMFAVACVAWLLVAVAMTLSLWRLLTPEHDVRRVGIQQE